MSAARYGLVIFPCFVAAAILLRRRSALAGAVLAIAAVLQVTLFVYWVRWGFVG
jgi:hypothetical protein